MATATEEDIGVAQKTDTTGWLSREPNGKAVCLVCALVLPSASAKAVAQHKRSLQHKRALSSQVSAATRDGRNSTSGGNNASVNGGSNNNGTSGGRNGGDGNGGVCGGNVVGGGGLGGDNIGYCGGDSDGGNAPVVNGGEAAVRSVDVDTATGSVNAADATRGEWAEKGLNGLKMVEAGGQEAGEDLQRRGGEHGQRRSGNGGGGYDVSGGDAGLHDDGGDDGDVDVHDDDDDDVEALRQLFAGFGDGLDLHTLSEARESWSRLLPSLPPPPLPPPLLRVPKRECPALDTPFVTTQCGRIPVIPDDLDEALGSYFTARRDAHPKVDVAERGRDACSWSDARKTLMAAEAAHERYWCTFFCPEMEHPPWWPKKAKGPGGKGEGSLSAPLFDQIIIGRGQTGIGIHADTYGAQRIPVSTCLTIMRGRKHFWFRTLLPSGIPLPSRLLDFSTVMLLPPSCANEEGRCSWFDDSSRFPLHPSPELLARIAKVGGYLFSMEAISESEEIGLALFTPAGWFHWLLGDVSAASDLPEKSEDDDWHVVFGGSFFANSRTKI